MNTLAAQVSVNRRFARSANVERDHGTTAIAGYLLTGRALDVAERIGRGLSDATAGRAFSLTGPHGGGKSSLAVFLDALFEPRSSDAHQTSIAMLRETDAGVAATVTAGLDAVDPRGRGAIRAFVTAERESVSWTIARALHVAAQRDLGPRQTAVPREFANPRSAAALTPADIVSAVRRLAAKRPVVLIIDEFGKNLEAYAEQGSDGDPYLLQELAESAQGESALPLTILTMQHLSFDEYVQEASASRRREWAKVQGRFQDIPYVEAGAQSRRLIAASFSRLPGSALSRAVERWYQRQAEELQSLGLGDQGADAASSYPLHPVALAVLPDLCARYGQNERTLFSFLAGREPLAVPAFMEARNWSRGALPFVRLDRVYDYFLDSAGTSIGTSATASRWLEVERSIRDASGLTEEQLRVLKTIGVLNLVASSGLLRASRRMLDFALGLPEESDTLADLESRGLITYREFADEYRIWQGSDFDLRGAVEVARRACAERSLATLLNDAAGLDPAIAGRHSQATGVLRVFARRFMDAQTQSAVVTPTIPQGFDGAVLYSTSERVGFQLDESVAQPVVVVVPEATSHLREAAIETAALGTALRSAEAGQADWVARKELAERFANSQHELAATLEEAWSPRTAHFILANDDSELEGRAGLSAVLSEACDRLYRATPRVGNEMIARRELTSQGAKARRMLIEAMIVGHDQETFGIKGYGPDRAMYEALFRSTGLHRPRDGKWQLTQPKDRRWKQVWAEISRRLREAKKRRVSLPEISEALALPPFGLKDGVIPVLLTAALLVHSEEVALYEHGSLVLTLDDAVAERLAKNPGHFTVKNPATDSGPRAVVVKALAERLGIGAPSSISPTFLQVSRAIYRELQKLPPFALKTRKHVSQTTGQVREAFKTASEPDALIFETLPVILGSKPFPAVGPFQSARATRYADSLADTILELRAAYPALLERVATSLAKATSTLGTLNDLQSRLGPLAAQASEKIIEPKLRAMVNALDRPHLEPTEWLENVAMVVAEGRTPRTWADDDEARFHINIIELGGALRRTLALIFDRLAEDAEGYESRRITITRSDGAELSEVLALSDHEAKEAADAVGPSLVILQERLGSLEAARRTLLAWLSMELTRFETSSDLDEGVDLRHAAHLRN